MSSFKFKHSFNRFFSELRVSQSSSNMRKLLILSPFNIIFVPFIMVIVISGWPVSQLLCECQLNLHPFSSWLSPPMVVFKEHVIQSQTRVKLLVCSNLVHMCGDVRLIVNDPWSNLGNMHVYQQAVVGVDFEEFILSQTLGLNVMLNVNMLVRKNYIWMSKLVSWGFDVKHSYVFVHLVSII